ncbi:MAG: 5'/3'-nucleotidase SurE [bacterium]
MKILLTNDDGIYSRGINNLVKVLNNKNHKLAVVAPDRERSAAGHSISIHQPLRVEEVNFNNLKDVQFFKISGTPADSVKLGIDTLIDFTPDLVISGINHGGNLGYDVLYSGTVSAAIEGWMMGYTAIAVSLNIDNNELYLDSARIFHEYIFSHIERFLDEHMLLNINLPDKKKEEIEGIEITKLSKSLYEDYYETRVDPMGKSYYWLNGNIKQNYESDSDIAALEQNKISITPLQLNLTNQKHRKKLENFIKN